MNAFQTAWRDEVDRALADLPVDAYHEVHDYRQTGATAQDKDLYIRSLLPTGSGNAELYAYADEASAQIEGNWYVFDKRTFPDQDALISAFGEFARRCASGEAPLHAFRAVQ
jgi:hypothetical protein